MRQKGFATIFGLCLILIVALIVKGIQEAEANHAREVLNFQMEQALQNAAYSGIAEAAAYVHQNPNYLPYSDGNPSDKKNIPVNSGNFKHGNKMIQITVEVKGERGKIYFYKEDKKTMTKEPHDGVYFMSRATIKKGIWGEKIYRRAYAYVLDDDTKIYFMEFPTLGENEIKKN
ncbi:MAG: hypothetical protein IJQ85_01350 [Selenomonadaceae bacterium]|nr:hypothetical protein [Selenomonadaceae bacterium]